MSTTRIIKLGNRLFSKYAQDTSVQSEVSARDALEFLIPITQGKLVFGKDKAQAIINYLNSKISNPSVPTKLFVDASYIDSIIANMVYSGMSDNDVAANAEVLLDALADQNLENTGSFTRASIAQSLNRYKEAMRKFNGDGEAASNWSAGMPQKAKEYQEAEAAKVKERERLRALVEKQKRNTGA